MIKLAATSFFLAISTSAVLAYSEPQSSFIEYDCVIIQKCDHQFLCKKTNEPTTIVYTSLIFDLSLTELSGPANYPFDNWHIGTAWVDLINPRAGKLPIALWYSEEAGFAGDITFRLEDWLEGKQESPFRIDGYALVMTGDVEEIGYSRANIDKADDLPWQMTFYKKKWDEPHQYFTQDLLCDSDW